MIAPRTTHPKSHVYMKDGYQHLWPSYVFIDTHAQHIVEAASVARGMRELNHEASQLSFSASHLPLGRRTKPHLFASLPCWQP